MRRFLLNARRFPGFLTGLLAATLLLTSACAPSQGSGPASRPGAEPASANTAPSGIEHAPGDLVQDVGTATPVTRPAQDSAGQAAPGSQEAKVTKSEEQWREILTPDQFYVLRKKGTERAWTGQYDKVFTPGKYECVGCGQVLFLSDHKYDSGCGWPAFFKPADDAAIIEHADRSFGMVRTEVVCSKCDGHLGHVFDDGPEPTGLRYCINSAVLKLKPTE